MRLPSLRRVAGAAARAAKRFPLVVTCALVAAGAGMVIIDSPIDEDPLERLLYVTTLGLPLFVGITLLAERRGWSTTRLALVRAAGVAALTGLFFIRSSWSEEVAALRYVQLSLGLHLFAAFAPYIRAGNLNGFWQYNRILFLRAVTTAIFAGVLFAGLAGALAGVDNLLGVSVEEETYGRLWFFIAFVFSTWFFLSGIPEDLGELDTTTDYPAIIKVFSQFVLTPIVTVYLAILTIYLGKILVTRVWPSGWIGYLVSGVAVVGILSLLLVHPIEDRKENQWIRNYSRWFYLALVPSIVMLLLAIWKRIDQYGITEKRYFLVVLSLWLAGIALFYIIKRSRNIKVIPTTLCLVSLATLFGPWGAYSVSRGSQTGRLERLLTTNDMLIDGAVQPAPAPLSFEDRKELSGIIRYLVQTHGTASIASWFDDRLAQVDTLADGFGPSPQQEADLRTELIVNSLGVEYVGRWATARPDRFNFRARRGSQIVSVAEFDYALREQATTSDSVSFGGRWYTFELDEQDATIVMLRDGTELIRIPVEPIILRAREQRRLQVESPALPPDILHTTAENDLVSVALYIRNVQGAIEQPDGDDTTDQYRIDGLTADYYWSEKQPTPD